MGSVTVQLSDTSTLEAPYAITTHPAMLYGLYSANNSDSGLLALEQSLGKPAGGYIRYRDMGAYHGAESAELASTRTLRIAWETRVYSAQTNTVTPAGRTAAGALVYTYEQILSGELDSYFAAVFAEWATLPRPFFVDLDHEPDDATVLGGSSNYRSAAGSPEQYCQVVAYVAHACRAAGVANAQWGVVYEGTANDEAYARLWPADAQLAYVGYDPYNYSAVDWSPPHATLSPFYARLDAGVLGDEAAALPRILGEFGCVRDGRRPGWLSDLPHALAELPKIGAAFYFSSDAGAYPVALENDPDSLAAFASVL